LVLKVLFIVRGELFVKLTRSKLHQLIAEKLGDLGTRGSTGDEYEPIDIEMPDTSGDIEIDFERDTKPRRARRKSRWNKDCHPYKLRKGCAMGYVHKIQHNLVKHGYSLGNKDPYGLGPGVDKYFGGKTHTALIDFQSKNGLNPTGVADKQTWDMLGKNREELDFSDEEGDTVTPTKEAPPPPQQSPLQARFGKAQELAKSGKFRAWPPFGQTRAFAAQDKLKEGNHLNLTQSRLQQIIKEEIRSLLSEAEDRFGEFDAAEAGRAKLNKKHAAASEQAWANAVKTGKTGGLNKKMWISGFLDRKGQAVEKTTARQKSKPAKPEAPAPWAKHAKEEIPPSKADVAKKKRSAKYGEEHFVAPQVSDVFPPTSTSDAEMKKKGWSDAKSIYKKKSRPRKSRGGTGMGVWLRRGSKGDDVKALQGRLIKAGFGRLLGRHQDDGKFGRGTEKALKAFQEKVYGKGSKLADKIYGSNTKRDLSKYIKRGNRTPDEYASHKEAEGKFQFDASQAEPKPEDVVGKGSWIGGKFHPSKK
tara:strand:+ start:3358 stop:4947 length:1590 start_codon:yes stop_codon:yes gene_type:complete